MGDFLIGGDSWGGSESIYFWTPQKIPPAKKKVLKSKIFRMWRLGWPIYSSNHEGKGNNMVRTTSAFSLFFCIKI